MIFPSKTPFFSHIFKTFILSFFSSFSSSVILLDKFLISKQNLMSHFFNHNKLNNFGSPQIRNVFSLVSKDISVFSHKLNFSTIIYTDLKVTLFRNFDLTLPYPRIQKEIEGAGSGLLIPGISTKFIISHNIA